MSTVSLNQRDEDDDAADGGDDGEGFEHGLSWAGDVNTFTYKYISEGRFVFVNRWVRRPPPSQVQNSKERCRRSGSACNEVVRRSQGTVKGRRITVD